MSSTLLTAGNTEHSDLIAVSGTAISEREQAFIDGAEATSNVPIIFVDPDALNPNNFVVAGAELRVQLDSEVPGLADALIAKAEEFQNNVLGATNVQIPYSEMANIFQTSGPFAIDKVLVNDQEYCIINKPSDSLDQASEIMSFLSDSTQAQFQVTDIEANRVIGRHEGEHCNAPKEDPVEPYSIDQTAQILTEEERAEQSALALEKYKTQLEFQDARILAAGSKVFDQHGIRVQSPTHAISDINEVGEPATKYHVDAASSFRDRMDNFAEQAIENGMYSGKATNAEELLEQDPNAYFSIVQASFASEHVTLFAQTLESPSFENLAEIVTLQAESDFAHYYEQAHRRRLLGEDVPETEPVQYHNQVLFDVFDRYDENRHEPYVREEVCVSQAAVISSSGLNMRREPYQYSSILPPDDNGKPSAISYGDQVSIYGDGFFSPLGGVFYQAVNSDGRSGWVAGNYLDIEPAVCSPINAETHPKTSLTYDTVTP